MGRQQTLLPSREATATILMGSFALANWQFRDFSNDFSPEQRYWLGENDLAKLFLAVLIAGISTLPIVDGLWLMEQESCYPSFLGMGSEPAGVRMLEVGSVLGRRPP